MESLGLNQLVVDGAIECCRDGIDRLVSELLPHCVEGSWLFLSGDLGAGKTTFVQALASRLGVAGPVTSPTFSVVNSCLIAAGEAKGAVRKLVHLDLYRIKTAMELLYLGIETEITPSSLVCVEWPELVDDDDWTTFFSMTRCPLPLLMVRVEILHGDGETGARRYSWQVFRRGANSA
jgi:tRNA threonylcarbamoyl adenosine modification protein YjeE